MQSFFSTHQNLVPVLILPNVFYLLLTLLPKHWLSVHFTWLWRLDESWSHFAFACTMHILCLHCKGRENFNFVRRFYWRTGKPTDCRRPGEEIRFILRYGFYQIPNTCKKRGKAGIYPRKFFWIFRKILG